MSKMTYEEYLNQYGKLTYRNVGVSMLPLLKQGRDLFTVEKKTDKRCRRYDVVLYRRPPSHYVLHRVVKVEEDGYVILGDNCIAKEYGIKDGDILGVMTEFRHKGKTYSVDCLWYRLYTRVWYALYPMRKIVLRLKVLLKKIKSGVFRSEGTR